MSGEKLHGVLGGRILCIHQGGVGDFILTLPALKALRDALRPAWIEFLGHPHILSLACDRPYADAVTDINRAEMALLFQDGASVPESLHAYLRGFDAAFCFSLSATLIGNLRQAGIAKVFSLPPFPEPGSRQHVMDHHLRSLAALGIAAPPSYPQISLREEDRTWARAFLRRRGWDKAAIVALHPGSGGKKKIWPPSRFAALGRHLAGGSKKILIIQGPADEGAVAEVLTGLDGIPLLVARDLPLRKVAALVSCASLFVGNDSGCTHLAAALGVWTLALFGPTDPLVWAPRGAQAYWLQGAAPCAPCTREGQHRCERPHCLEAIEVETVLAFLAQGMKDYYHGTAVPPQHEGGMSDGGKEDRNGHRLFC